MQNYYWIYDQMRALGWENIAKSVNFKAWMKAYAHEMYLYEFSESATQELRTYGKLKTKWEGEAILKVYLKYYSTSNFEGY